MPAECSFVVRASMAVLLFLTAFAWRTDGAPSPARIVDYLIGYTRVGDLDKLYTQYAYKYLDVTIHNCERTIVDPLGDLRRVIVSESASDQEFTASVSWYYVFPDKCFTPIYRREYLRCMKPRRLEDCYTTSPFMWAREFATDATLAGSSTGIELLGLNKKLEGTYMLVVRIGSTTHTSIVTIDVVGECPVIQDVRPAFRANCWRGYQFETDFNGDDMYIFDTEEEHRRAAYADYGKKLALFERLHPNVTAPPKAPPRAPTIAAKAPALPSRHPGDADYDMSGCAGEPGCDSDQPSVYEPSEPEESDKSKEHTDSESQPITYPLPTINVPDAGDNNDDANYGDEEMNGRPTFSLLAFILVALCVLIILSLFACTIKRYCRRPTRS